MALPPNLSSGFDPSSLLASTQQGVGGLSSLLTGAGPAGNYISPEQLQQLRTYAQALTKNSMTPARNGWQGLSNVANAFMGGLSQSQANNQNAQMIQQTQGQNAALSNIIARFNGGATIPTATPAQGSTSTQTSDTSTSADPIETLKSNIANRIESGGNYDALGPTTDSGDRAYGKYQVMGSNIPQWTKETLGTELTPQQFLQNHDAQEAVASNKLGQYYQQTGSLPDAASMWFTGKPLAQGGARAADQNGMTGANYAKIATSGMPGNAPTTPPASNAAPAYNSSNVRVVNGVPVHADTGQPFTQAEIQASANSGIQQPNLKLPPGAQPPVQVASLDPSSGISRTVSPPGLTQPSPGSPQPNVPQPMKYNPDLSGPGTMGSSPMVQALRGQTPPSAATPPPVNPAVVQALQGQTSATPPPVQSQPPVAQNGPPSSPGMMTAAQYNAIISDPRTPPEVRQQVMSMMAPTQMQGPLGMVFGTSTARMMNNQAPQLWANPGVVNTTEINDAGRFPVFSRVNPDTNTVNSNVIGPGQFRLDGGVPNSPPPQTSNGGGSVPQPSIPATGVAAPGGSPAVSADSNLGPLASYGPIIRAATAIKSSREGAVDRATADAKSYAQSQDMSSSIARQIDDLQSFQGALRSYKGAIPLGAAEGKTEKIMNVANTLGLGGPDLQGNLASLELVGKNAKKYMLDQMGSVPGVEGHALNAAFEAAQATSPDKGLSAQGNLDITDSLLRAKKLQQTFELSKQNYYDTHHNSLSDPDQGTSFINEWIKGIHGQPSQIPNAGITLLSKVPFGMGTKNGPIGSDGNPTKIPVYKYPSTDPKGWSWASPDDHQLQ